MSGELNAAIRHIPLPARLARRPINARGFPVPWFATFHDGAWDLVNVDPRRHIEAHRRRVCWLCGEPLGKYAAFVIGPMCSVNRVSSEPPAHRECAEYAVKACPFLARPNARRNDKAALGKAEDVPGVMLTHNPGATLIWITKSFHALRGLFHLGEAVSVAWYAEGREATRAEVDAAMAKGLPLLRDMARQDGGELELERNIARVQKWLPAEVRP